MTSSSASAEEGVLTDGHDETLLSASGLCKFIKSVAKMRSNYCDEDRDTVFVRKRLLSLINKKKGNHLPLPYTCKLLANI